MARGKAKLPSGWTRASIAEVGAVRLGRQRSPDKHTGRFATKYLRAGNITPAGLDLLDILEMDFTLAEREVFTLIEGDVVLTEASGSAAQVGRAAIWRDQVPGCCFQNTVIRWRPHAVTSEFALITSRYLANSGEFERIARGVGIQHLGASRFSEIVISVPPLAEQVRISKAVETKLSELTKAEAALQDALAGIAVQDKEILAAAATGHLVESEADIAGRTGKTFESGAQMLARVHASFSDDRDLFAAASEELGDPPSRDPLPSGWTWTTVAAAGEIMLGKMREPRRHKGANMRPYLRVANVFEARIDVSDVHEMNFSKKEADTYRLRKGDILLNEGQSPELVGRPAMFNNELANVCFQNTLLRFRASPAVDPDFALLVFRHYLHAGIFMRAAQWSTNIAHLSKSRFSALPFPVPPRAEQRRIVAEGHQRLRESSAQRREIEKSLARIPEMLTQLLDTAVNGTLVPQDDRDEPASALLARLGPVPRDVVRLVGIENAVEAAPVTEVLDPDDAPRPNLSAVLLEAGRPMALPDLCHAAGFDRNSVGDIERFYIALRTELGSTIRVARAESENALVEATHATR